MMTTKNRSMSGISRRNFLVAGAAMLTAPTLLRAQEKIVIRLAHGDPAASSVGVTAAKFAELAAQKTGGRVTVQVFPDGVLFGGDQNAAINQLGAGGLQMVILSSNVFASFEPRINVMSLPYLFANYDELNRFIAGEPGLTLLRGLDRINVHGVAMMLHTFRQTTTRDQPITRIEDFRGLKIRVPNNQLYVKFFQALQANPTPMAFPEVYTALQLKVIDGQENPVEVPLANRFYEVQKQLSLTSHIGDAFVMAANKAMWSGLPPDVRTALQAAAVETAAFKSQYDIAQETKVIAELKSRGMTVNELAPGEKQKLQKVAGDLYPQFEQLIGRDFLKQSLAFLGRS